jgi:hypothetical protein
MVIYSGNAARLVARARAIASRNFSIFLSINDPDKVIVICKIYDTKLGRVLVFLHDLH